jgi:transcriptional regulator with XRE-family HTH domain
MSSLDELGKKLKNIRKKLELTQADVADRAGIHVNYYAKIERGEVNPTYEVIESIVKALKVRSSDILPF